MNRFFLRAVPAALLVLGLAGCATDGPLSGTVHYRCDNGLNVAVRSDGSAAVQTARGTDMLLRDAGGLTPAQAVYSNPQMRLETGLGADGSGARIEGMVPNQVARCGRIGGGGARPAPAASFPPAA